MGLKYVRLPRNGKSIAVGMGDFELLTPDDEHRVQIWYRGKPPEVGAGPGQDNGALITAVWFS